VSEIVRDASGNDCCGRAHCHCESEDYEQARAEQLCPKALEEMIEIRHEVDVGGVGRNSGRFRYERRMKRFEITRTSEKSAQMARGDPRTGVRIAQLEP
jgi:hypothetical protein